MMRIVLVIGSEGISLMFGSLANCVINVYYNNYVISIMNQIKLSFHWFLGQTTPFALLELVGAIGRNQTQLFVPNT